MFRYHEMKSIAEEKQRDYRRLEDQKRLEEYKNGHRPENLSSEPKRYGLTWIISLITFGFLS